MSVVPYERAWIALQSPAVELANAIAGTDFVPQGLRGNPAAITAAILYGDEVGLGPMQSLAKIAVIQGRPTLAAEAQRALILAAGHDLWIEESTTTKAVVAGRRKDSDQTSRITWTMDDAKRAGIAGKQPWRQYPRQMLLARASAELARMIFADAIGGLAATEEADESDVVAEIEQVEPTRRRRRANVSLTPTPAVVEHEPPPLEEPPLPGEMPQSTEAAADAVPEDDPNTVPGTAMTDAQRKLLMALFRESGYHGREHRLAWTTVQIGRHITSSSQLTSDEASMLIDKLRQLQEAVES